MMSYCKSEASGRAILTPKTEDKFVIQQAGIDDISKKKNLAGKTYKGTVAGMPNGMTSVQLAEFSI